MEAFVNPAVQRLVAEALRRANRHRVYRPIVANQSRLETRSLSESASATDGIYYAMRAPSGWTLFAYRFDEFPEIDHSELWETHVAPILALRWAPSAKAAKLEAELASFPYAFPRGRVSRSGNRFLVSHGGDLPASITKSAVMRAFSLPPNTPWELDNHEICAEIDRDAVRRLLKLKETWPAT